MTRILASRSSRRGETGASATEYALLVAGVAMIIAAGAWFFGESLETAYAGFSGVIDSL